MKKQTILGVLLLFVMFCFNAKAEVITVEGASEIANAFFTQSARSQKTQLKTATQLEYAWDSNSLTQSGSSMLKSVEEDPTFYVFNNPDGEGFVIVSGDSNTRSIIGYSFEGNAPAVTDIPLPMQDYLSGIDAEVKYARENITSTSKNLKATEAEIGNVVMHLETPTWDQTSPFNKYCYADATQTSVYSYTGCIATAYSMIMKYHGWPKVGTGDLRNQHTGDAVTGRTYDFDKMLMSYTGTYTTDEADAVAKLMADLGHAYMIVNGNGNEGSTTENLYKYFSYTNVNASYQSNFTIDSWKEKIEESLDNGSPIPYTSDNDASEQDARHIFVLDGYTDNDYYHFNFGWSGGGNGWYLLTSINPLGSDYSWKEDGLSDQVAFFNLKPIKRTVTIETTPSNAGNITINGEDVTSRKDIANGETIRLEATSTGTAQFVGWYNGNISLSSENPYSTTITSDVTYTAKFSDSPILLYVDAVAGEDLTGETNENNKVESSATTVCVGDIVNLKAQATRGYRFDGWYAPLYTEAPLITTQAETSITILANYIQENMLPIVGKFSQLPTVSFTAEPNDANGTVSKYVGQTKLQATDPIYSGEQITLSATPNSGYVFEKWTDANGNQLSTNATYSVTAADGAVYKAHFKVKSAEKYNVFIGISGGGSAGCTAYIENGTQNLGTYAQNIEEGTELRLYAVPVDGYDFVCWSTTSSTSNSISTENPYTTTVNGHINWYACFTKSTPATTQYTVTATANPTDGGTAKVNNEQSVTVDSGTTVTLLASPNSGYTFVNWTKGGSEVSTSASFTASVTADADYVANFTEEGNSANTEALINSAKELIKKAGVGYPNETERTTLQSAIDAAEANPTASAGTTLQSAIDAYYATANVQMPTAGTTYSFIVGHDLKAYIYNNNGTLALASYTEGDELPETAKFTCEVSDGKYLFKTSDNKYIPYPKQYNGQLQTSTSDYTKFNIIKIVNGGYVEVENSLLFGKLYLQGKRDVTAGVADAAVVVQFKDKNNGTQLTPPTFDAASDPYGNGNFSSAISIIEVEAESTPETPQYTITVSASPAEGGTATVNNEQSVTVESGTEVTFTASPNTGYNFLGWYNGENKVSESLEYTATVTSDLSLTAKFAKQTFTVSATPNGTNGTVTVSPNGTVEYGTEVTFTATANPGYRFTSWSNGEKTNPYTTTITANTTLTASFELIPTYTVTVRTNGTGGSAIVSQGTVQENGTVTLTATPESDYRFVNWTLDGEVVSTDAVYTTTAVTESREYVANFEVKPQTQYYSVVAIAGTGGSATASSNSVEEGQSVELTATAAEGYQFVNWTVAGKEVSTDNPYTTTITADTKYVAHFVPENANTLPTGYCTISSLAPNWAHATSHSLVSFGVNVGGAVQLASENVPSSAFNDLTGSKSVTAKQGDQLEITFVNGTYSNNVWAGFDWDRDGDWDVVVAAYSEPGRTGGSNDEGSITITIPDDAKLGKSRLRILSDGDVSGASGVSFDKSSPMCGTYGAGKIGYAGSYYDITLYVEEGYVSDVTYNVTVSSADENMGTASASRNIVPEKRSVTLTAEPKDGYRFVNWTNEGTEVSTENPYTIQSVTDNINYVANYAKRTYTVTVSTNNEEWGTVNTIANPVTHGETVTLTAEPKDGCRFVNWTKGQDVVSTDATFTTEAITANVEYIANFQLSVQTEKLTITGSAISGVVKYWAENNCDKEKAYDGDYNTKFIGCNNGGTGIDAESTFTITLRKLSNVYEIKQYYEPSSNDLPQNAVIEISTDNQQWTKIADVNTSVINDNKEFSCNAGGAEAKYIRIRFLASQDQWFRLNEFEAYGVEIVQYYAVSASTSNRAMGKATMSVAGPTVEEGASVTFTATPYSGYEFVNWTNAEDTPVSTSASYTTTINANTALTANFQESTSLAGNWYRIKETSISSGKYLNAANYDTHAEGPVGGVNVVAFNANSNDQIFLFEKSGTSYKLKTKSGYYINCQNWNVDASSKSTGTALTFEDNGNGTYTIKNGSYFFKVEMPTNYTEYYPYCDGGKTAGDDLKKGVWVLEKVTISSADITRTTATKGATVEVTTDAPATIKVGGTTYTTTAENLTATITLDATSDVTVTIESIGATITEIECDENATPTEIPLSVTELTLRNVEAGEVEIEAPLLEKITIVSDAESKVATVAATSDLSQGVQVVVEKEIKTSQPVADKGTPTYFNFLSMPFAFNTADIKYWDGDSWETAEAENHIRILTYNCETRATGDYKNTWETVAQGESIDIAANQGFVIVGSNAIGNEGAGYKMKLQFTSAAEAYTQDGNTKSVATTANDNNSHEYDKNWNIVGVPYLTSAINPATTIYTNNGYSYDYTVPAEDCEIKPYQAFMLQTTETLEFTPATTAALNITKALEGVYARAYISVDESSPAKIILSDESSENFVVNEDAWYTAPTSNAVSANYFIVDGCQAGATVQPAANELPMNVYTGAGTSHRISLTATDGNYNVYLKDAATDETVCLNDEDYTFTATAKTTIADRFTVSMIEPTGIIDAARAEGAIKPVVLSNAIKLYGTEEGDQVSLYTANGMLITNAVTEEGVTTIPTSVTGVIIIKVAGETIKVVK